MVFYRKTLINCDVCGTLCPMVGILCENLTTVPYAMSTPEAMAKAVDEIKEIVIEELAADGICGIY